MLRDRDDLANAQANFRCLHGEFAVARSASPAGARPLGFDSGETNLYRYVRNNPIREPDNLGLFTYQWKPEQVKFLSTNLIISPRTKGLTQIGYGNLRLDIVYDQVRRNVSFIQLNTVMTTVVTVDADGKVAAVSTTRYYEDATDASGDRLFQDMLGGPNFDRALRADAVIVISRMRKVHGLIPGRLQKVRGTEIRKARADEIEGIIGAKGCLEKGDISYDYYWSEIDKATARKAKPADLLKQLEQKVGAKEIKDFLDAVKGRNKEFDFEKFNGQLLISEAGKSVVGKEEKAGLYVEADLKGAIKK